VVAPPNRNAGIAGLPRNEPFEVEAEYETPAEVLAHRYRLDRRYKIRVGGKYLTRNDLKNGRGNEDNNEKAGVLDLPLRPLAPLAQNEELGSTSREARGRGRMGLSNEAAGVGDFGARTTGAFAISWWAIKTRKLPGAPSKRTTPQ
jgi:hypothetical protein